MKRICVFTGTRADYGLLKPLMEKMRDDNQLDLKLLVSGMHLYPEFGLTVNQIEEDSFYIDEQVRMLVGPDTSAGLCKSMGFGLMEYADAIERINPDGMVILGDRFEAFAAAIACFTLKVPIFHIHGGELSSGAMDDAFRHCITKMSHLHFTCAAAYQTRVIQLGEHPGRVFNVGALGVENIKNMSLLSEDDIKKDMGLSIQDKYLLVTFHPETLGQMDGKIQFQELLGSFADNKCDNYKIVFTKANADVSGRRINQMIDGFETKNKNRVRSFASMGQLRYLSAMKYASAVVGNSSSGIIEAPSFKVPVINIGDRQKGRIRADNIIDCRTCKTDIEQALKKGLSKEFKASLLTMESPFEKENTAENIKTIIMGYDSMDLKKEFYTVFNGIEIKS
ncbi:MAG: UDP-N-acetylglucosamine 2-epimerase [Pseudomonadota bacterium]